MDNKFCFFPLIKTKRSERVCLKRNFPLFFGGNITPYLEVLLDQDEAGKSEKPSIDEWLSDFLKGKPASSIVVEFFHDKSLLTHRGAEKVGNRSYLAYNGGNKLYLNDTKSLFAFPAVIPSYVIDQSTGSDLNNVLDFIREGHSRNFKVALRVDTTTFIDFSSLSPALSLLSGDDILFIDIKKGDYAKKLLAIKRSGLQDDCLAKMVILSDDRPSKTNSQFASYGYDESAAIHMINRNESPKKPWLYGFGGYCGAKNNLDSGGSSKNKMYAIALIYDDSKREFFTIVSDKGNGQQDYHEVKAKVLGKKRDFDPHGDCPAYHFIETKKEPGGWTTWILFGIIRYIDQMRRYLKREKPAETLVPNDSNKLLDDFLQESAAQDQQE